MKKSHFILMKHSGFNADRVIVTGYESARLLLKNKLWPLWENTRCKNMVEVDHKLLIYIAGNEEHSKCVIASAEVSAVELWSDKKHKKNYPLLLDGIPGKVLMLKNIEILEEPLDIRKKLDTLSFIPENKKKWGVAMMGGMRPLLENDYFKLSGIDA